MSANVSVRSSPVCNVTLRLKAPADDVTMRDGATASPDLVFLFVFVGWEESWHLLHLLSAEPRRMTLREALVQGSQVHSFIVDE